MRHRTRSWTVENNWECSSCHSTNLGRAMNCSSCGHPKEKDEKYTLGDVTTPVTDQRLLQQASAGTNWSCAYCKFDNRNLVNICGQCGAVAPKSSTILPPPIPESTHNFGSAPSTDAYKSEQVKVRGRTEAKKWVLVIAVVSLVVTTLVALFWFLSPHEHSADVTSIRWEYIRTLEQRYTRNGSGWGSPAGSFNTSCTMVQRGTENCHPHNCNFHQVEYDCRPHDCDCHQSCSDLGNGYSECSEDCDTCYETCYRTDHDTCYDTCPVYDNWCTYSYYEWESIDTETTSGNDHNTHWGTRLHADETVPQRMILTESYSVVFRHSDDHWSYSTDSLEDFARFDVGVTWDVKTNYAGMIWPVRPLR